MPTNANRPIRDNNTLDLFATQANNMIQPQGPVPRATEPLRYTIGAAHEAALQPFQPNDTFQTLFMLILQLQHHYWQRLWPHTGRPLAHHEMLQDFLRRSRSHLQQQQRQHVFSQRNASLRTSCSFHPYHQVQHSIISQLDQVVFQGLAFSLLPLPVQEWLRRTAPSASRVMITAVYGLRTMHLGSTYAHASSPHYMIVLCRNTNGIGSSGNSNNGPISLSPIPYHTNQSTEARLFVVCYSTPSSPPDMYSFGFPLSG